MRMTAILIPKKLGGKGDLVIVLRKEYETLQQFWASAERLTRREKNAISQGFREIAQRKFLTSKQLRHELGL